MAITVNLFLKKDYVARDGTCPIYLRLTIHRRVEPPIKTGHRCLPDQWDDNKREIRSSHPQSTKINMLLQRELLRARDVLLDHELSSRPVTIQSFKKEFGGESPYDFYILADEYREMQAGVDSYEYLEKVRHVINKVKEFSPRLQLQQIDVRFLTSYRQHLTIVRKNSPPTIYSNMKIIRRVLKEAVKRRLIKNSPFSDFMLHKGKSKRDSLRLEEFRKYEQLLQYDLPHYLRNILCWFILAVYSGRRYNDLVHFTNWEILEDHIRIPQMKKVHGGEQDKVIILFLNKPLRSILSIIEKEKLQPPSNASANKFLREINKRIGQLKEITFHSARHTFNNINKRLSTDLSVRRDLLGHDSINSTMIYDHKDEDLLKEAMLKWDRLN